MLDITRKEENTRALCPIIPYLLEMNTRVAQMLILSSALTVRFQMVELRTEPALVEGVNKAT